MPPGILQEALVPGPYFANRSKSDPPIGGIYGCDLIITTFPGDWDIRVEEGEDGCPYYPLTKDLDIIYELQMAVDDEIHRQTLEDENRITSELEWIEAIAYCGAGCAPNPFSVSGPYFFIDEGQFDGSEDLFRALMLTEIEIAVMDQFEQDFDYEQSLILEQKGNDEINLHRLLACPFDKRPGWCGEVGEEPQRVFWGAVAQVCGNGDWTYRKERYKWPVEIIRLHPEHKSNGYAVGKTPYGKVYFPEKFRGYLPEVGSSITTTVALQDVGGSNKKGNAFRFTAIYTH